MNPTISANIERGAGDALFFDADCRLCAGTAARWRKVLERHGFAVLPLQSSAAHQALGFGAHQQPNEMKVISDGDVFGGADALIEIARRIWWARPLAVIGSTSPVRRLLHNAYVALAERRRCFDGTCRISSVKRAQGSVYDG